MKPKLKRSKDLARYRSKLKRDEEIESGAYHKPGHQVHKDKKDYSRKNKDWEREVGEE